MSTSEKYMIQFYGGPKDGLEIILAKAPLLYEYAGHHYELVRSPDCNRQFYVHKPR